MDKRFCLDLDLDEITSWCKEKSFPSYRSGQLYKWLSSGVTDLDEMTNIPKDMKAALSMSSSLRSTERLSSFSECMTDILSRPSSCATSRAFPSVYPLRQAARWAAHSVHQLMQVSEEALREARC